MSDAYADLAALRRQFGNWIIQAQDDNSAHEGLCLAAEPRLGRERGPYITRKTAPEMRAALAAEDGRREREQMAGGTGPAGAVQRDLCQARRPHRREDHAPREGTLGPPSLVGGLTDAPGTAPPGPGRRCGCS
jgi:hypothetical protein